jgi:peptidyl-prolyl cis-trans isomerase-like protein 2
MIVYFIALFLDSWYVTKMFLVKSVQDTNVFQIQTGDPSGTGSGGESYWGIPFRDEHDLKGAAKHDSRGILAMANKGANTNGRVYFTAVVYCLLTKVCSSQFYLTFKAAAHLDKKHTVFGKLVGGEEVLDALESLPVKSGTDRPAKMVRIVEVVMSVIPFFKLRRPSF